MHATLSAKGQLVLPVAMRRRLRLAPGATIELDERAGGVFLRPVGSRPLPPPKGTCADLLALGDKFGAGVDWDRVKAAVSRRARSRDLR